MSDQQTAAAECTASTRHSVYTRHCFVTGEMCSKQTNIRKEREELHSKNEINAFVIMNFSGMSDVVYECKLLDFIRSLSKYLYLDRESHQIACVKEPGREPKSESTSGWTPVEKIHVIRADSNTASNYIICSRICQQIQIADLIIVDVSVENSNVFYEFGLAAAFGKLILPICYSGSFYEMKIPASAAQLLNRKKQQLADTTDPEKREQIETDLENLRMRIEHHIDCYPWRRKLFEHYGLRYRTPGSLVRYGLFSDAVSQSFGFSDVRYGKHPYDKIVSDVDKPASLNIDTHDWIGPEGYQKVGYLVYDRLRASYHTKETDKEPLDSNEQYIDDPHAGDWNTLVVYTMDGVLNEDQAGLCIVNFYRNMTEQLQLEHCFCGDRVAILCQPNVILDDPKDTKVGKKLPYGVGDIVRIGMDKATNVSQQKQIKPRDYLLDDQAAYDGPVSAKAENNPGPDKQDWSKDILRFVTEHIRNRCIPLPPDEPIYVNQYTDGIQQHLFDINELDGKARFDHANFFTSFHMMLYTLRYANEVVVDISGNSLQALFWLGVAHGCDVPAITVRHTPTPEEISRMEDPNVPRDRRIFDVAGLWTATLKANDVDSFYDQLSMTQTGIEQHNRLTLPNIDTYRSDFMELFNETWRKVPEEKKNAFTQFISRKSEAEGLKLESFYRNSFWRRLLRSNELDLYIVQNQPQGPENLTSDLHDTIWDFRASAELTHYLSKRTVIGQYTLREIKGMTDGGTSSSPAPTGAGTEGDKNAEMSARQKQMEKIPNYISIGGKAHPLPSNAQSIGLSLAAYINEFSGCTFKIHAVNKREYRLTRADAGTFEPSNNNSVLDSNGSDTHTAQMILWREVENKETPKIKFWGSLVGASGPATLALTSVVMDENQKKRLFTQEGTINVDIKHTPWCTTPLNDLQHRIRTDILQEYDKHLAIKMGIPEDNPSNAPNYSQYMQLSRITQTYLSTILYRFFFPFLSRSDEKRICNSMHAFLIAMSKSGNPAFTKIKLDDAVIKHIETALKETVQSMRGVVVYYNVDIQTVGDKEKRWPVGISFPENRDPKRISIACLYTAGKADSRDTPEVNPVESAQEPSDPTS